MTEADWAPFRNLAPDPWPKVADIAESGVSCRTAGGLQIQFWRGLGPKAYSWHRH